MLVAYILGLLVFAAAVTAVDPSDLYQVFPPAILPPEFEAYGRLANAPSDDSAFMMIHTLKDSFVARFDLVSMKSYAVVPHTTRLHSTCDGHHPYDGPQADVHPAPRDVVLAGPTALHATAHGQLLLGNAMPSSNLFSLSQRPPYGATDEYAVSRIGGTPCNYSQKFEEDFFSATDTIATGLDALLATHLPPISAVATRPSTGDIFLAFFRTIAVIDGATGQLRRFYGDPTPLETPPPAEWWNTSVPNATAPPGVTAPPPPPLPTQVHRLNGVSAYIGGMAVIQDKYLLFSDGLYHAVRKIDLDTGIVTNVVSAPLSQWPPAGACLLDGTGCDATNMTIQSPNDVVPVTADSFFVASTLTPSVFLVNMTTGRVILYAGVTPYDIVTKQPAAANNPLPYVSSIAVANGKLLMSSGRRLFAKNLDDLVLPPPPTPPRVCDVWVNCSGHASQVFGVPALGCECDCKGGWTGLRCEVPPPSHTATFTESLPVPTDKPVPVPFISPVVKDAAQTTVVVTTVVSGVIGTPTVATQAGRAKVLMSLQICEQKVGDPLGFTETPFNAAVGTSPARYLLGAVLANIGSIVALIVVLYFAAACLHLAKRIPMLEAQALCRCPSMASFPLLFVGEGTAFASVMLIRQPGDVTFPMVGAIGICICTGVLCVIAVFIKVYFRATYELYSSFVPLNTVTYRPPVGEHLNSFSELSQAMRTKDMTFGQRLLHLIRYALNEKGKWREPVTHQTRRFGGIFMDYRPGMQGFVICDLGLNVIIGSINAMKDLHCLTVTILIMVLYVAYFIAIAKFSPAVNRLATATMGLVSGLQALAAVLIVVAALFDTPAVGDVAESITLVSMFIVGVMSFIDAAIRLYYILRYLATCRSASRQAVENATFLASQNAEPLLPANGRQHSSGSSGDRAASDDSSTVEMTRITITREERNTDLYSPQTASGPGQFPNFSFDARHGGPPGLPPLYRAPSPAPSHRSPPPQGTRTATPGSGSNMSFGQQRAFEQLRVELDDLLAGRQSNTARFDELMESARAVSSSSAANPMGMMHQRTNSSNPPHSSSDSNRLSHPSSSGSITQHALMRRSQSNMSFNQAGSLGFAPPAAAGHITTSSSSNTQSGSVTQHPSNRSLAGLGEALMNMSRQTSSSNENYSTNNSMVRRRHGNNFNDL
jgi:hypothetical protein